MKNYSQPEKKAHDYSDSAQTCGTAGMGERAFAVGNMREGFESFDVVASLDAPCMIPLGGMRRHEFEPMRGMVRGFPMALVAFVRS